MRLLCAYREALKLAADPPPSRAYRVRALTWLLYRLRPTWGLEGFVVDHVRGRIDILTRRFCLRLSVDEREDNDDEDLEALKSFASSLPPPRPRWLAVLPLFATLLISQILLAVFGEVENEKEVLDKVIGVLDLNPGNFNEAVRTLLNSDLVVVFDVLGIVLLAIYLVFRPMLPAFRLKRMILGLPGATGRRQAGAPLPARAGEIAVHDEEVALFRALGMPTPPESALDLRVKATVVLFWLVGAIHVAFVPPPELVVGMIMLALVAWRGWWLLRQRRKRSMGSMMLVSHASAP